MSFGETGARSGRTEEIWPENAGDGGMDGGAGAGDANRMKRLQDFASLNAGAAIYNGASPTLPGYLTG
jgi:hypothetical protein